MTDVGPLLLSALKALSPWEIAAVLLAIAYLLLAIRQNIGCWLAALASTTIYTVLMFDARLYMEAGLQLFYIGMAVYGWYSWRHGDGPDNALPVTRWAAARHVRIILAIVVLSVASGYALQTFSDAAWPYLDSLTTWGAIVATWMVARKILENWLYWFVIDSLSIFLYVDRSLYLTAALFGLYLVLIVFGYLAWRKQVVAS